MLKMIADERLMWSPHGLRSLSASDELFHSGEDYWKGNIWININYMVLAALHKHYVGDGPYVSLARQVYADLRTAVVSTITNSFTESGFIWEQYHPVTGAGMRTHPFTGWSALVVKIMAESY